MKIYKAMFTIALFLALAISLASSPATAGGNKNDGNYGDYKDGNNVCWKNCPPVKVPEPSSLILLGSGLAGLGLWGLKRGKGTKA